ncbi:MAG: hypothetical protein LBC18_10300 [Opitutaceae bacterium]|jgi:hypothetical protein|nr:hypothetical protein [Opitutaceae bacterium]
MEKTKEKAKQLDESTRQWLESRPELVRRLKEMRRICENGQREHEVLAKAEAGLVEQLDAAGRELAGAWLEKREEQEHAKARAQTRMREHSKKTACADGVRGGGRGGAGDARGRPAGEAGVRRPRDKARRLFARIGGSAG